MHHNIFCVGKIKQKKERENEIGGSELLYGK